MTLQGANNFNESDKNTIYTMNSTQTGQYSVVIPKNTDNNINMLVDLNMKTLFDSLIGNTIDKDSLVKEINEEYDNIVSKYPSGVLVLPMLDINELSSSINSNDKQKMFDETKKIGSITSEIYQKLSVAGIDKSKIDQKIIIVEKTDVDTKFVSWLKEQMPNFVDGINYEELKNSGVSEVPNGNVNPFTGEANVLEPMPVNDVFGVRDAVEPAAPEVVADVQAATPEPVVDANNSNDFLTSNSGDVNTETISSEQQPIAEPQPVVDTKLETTQAVPNVSENVDSNVTPVSNNEEQEVNELDKKSGGFANLLILMVILVVVTVASIELGKFLYSSFGA